MERGEERIRTKNEFLFDYAPGGHKWLPISWNLASDGAECSQDLSDKTHGLNKCHAATIYAPPPWQASPYNSTQDKYWGFGKIKRRRLPSKAHLLKIPASNIQQHHLPLNLHHGQPIFPQPAMGRCDTENSPKIHTLTRKWLVIVLRTIRT